MNGRVVLDASAAIHMVMRSKHAERLIDVLNAAAVVTAPTLFCAETANALWKYVRHGDLDRETAVTRLEEAHALVDSFAPDRELCAEALVAAQANGHPVYDLLYIVEARRRAAALLTMDRRLAELAGSMQVTAVFGAASA